MSASKRAKESNICDEGIALDERPAAAATAAPPFRTRDWQATQRVRRLNRELQRPALGGPSAIATPLGARRLDPPQSLHDQFESVAAPASISRKPESGGRQSAASRRGTPSQVAAWLIIVAGAIVLAAGIGLIVWSLANGQMRYWNLALGLALGGQGTLIFGLVLVVARLWRNSRHASTKLQDVQTRLAQLQHTADALTGMRSGGAPAFYADLVRGASPQMLVSNLKGQLDRLATRVGSTF
jgi:hypothetical protein